MFLLGLLPLVLIVPFAATLLPESTAFLLARGEVAKAQAIADKHGFTLPDLPTRDPAQLQWAVS